MSQQDYDYSQHTPIDTSSNSYSPFRSGYKNIRFALATATTLTITHADMANLVGIAFRLYGDVSLWYMLLAFNGIQDQVQEIYPGLVLSIPNKNDVIAYLAAQKNNKPLTRII